LGEKSLHTIQVIGIKRRKIRNDIEFPIFFLYWGIWYALGWAFMQGSCIDLGLEKSFV
jgi:hypothetical protein